MTHLLPILGTGRREKTKPKGKLLPQVIETTEKLIRRGYSPGQMANTALRVRHPLSVSNAVCTLASCCTEINHSLI